MIDTRWAGNAPAQPDGRDQLRRNDPVNFERYLRPAWPAPWQIGGPAKVYVWDSAFLTRQQAIDTNCCPPTLITEPSIHQLDLFDALF